MPVSDGDRIFARRHADERQRFHDDRKDTDNKISTTLSGAEVHYRGLLGECEFVRVFGGVVDVALRPSGDGGRDFKMKMLDKAGKSLTVPIDLKVSSYNGADSYLRVPCNKLVRNTIYIDAHYHVDDDDVYLRGWQWGSVIKGLNQVQTFSSRGTQNFIYPIGICRGIDELLARASAPAESE